MYAAWQSEAASTLLEHKQAQGQDITAYTGFLSGAQLTQASDNAWLGTAAGSGGGRGGGGRLQPLASPGASGGSGPSPLPRAATMPALPKGSPDVRARHRHRQPHVHRAHLLCVTCVLF